MRKIIKFAGAFIAILATTISLADTIELADGTVLQGDFVGSSLALAH